MRFLEALEQLKEGQMIVSGKTYTKQGKSMSLSVKWDWGYKKPNEASGYIPRREHVKIVPIPKPTVKATDVAAHVLASYITGDGLPHIAAKLTEALSADNVVWD